MVAHMQKNNKPRKPAGKESSQPLIIAKTPEFVRDVMGSSAGAGSSTFAGASDAGSTKGGTFWTGCRGK
ncbi:hypothetical protein CesoFtcFv8_005005 [Champsocephalus esox]|uniref:Uncharacterized protein n=1 Tax=Champsocephalus esox TaxID=159716 RepID=A0AAN8CNJ8_9TELE|nr:hypothetical protein CesoFtcFv8_005005 [Champsocephalus esox]